MQKRGQITIILVLVVFIVIILSIVIYLNSVKSQRGIETSTYKAVGSPLDATPIKLYLDSVFAQTVEHSLATIGVNGGYISINVNESYNETGFPDYVIYEGSKIPYYTRDWDLSGSVTPNEVRFLPLQNITDRLRRYVLFWVGNQSNFSFFREHSYIVYAPNISFQAISYNLTKASLSYTKARLNLSVNANDEDVAFMLSYPIIVLKREGSTELVDFTDIVPYPLKDVYQNISFLLNEIVSEQPLPYDLAANCNKYTAVNDIRLTDLGASGLIVNFSRIISPDYNYTFRFGLRDVSVTGECRSIRTS
ncbi:MAG: hypothetical protein V1837_07305 [Candidatus Woesearchaeota archaeon]